MNKAMNNLKSLFVVSISILAGCSTYSETFECPPGLGVGCKSISEVDQMIDEGKFSDEQPIKELPIDLANYKPIWGEELPTSHPSSVDSVHSTPTSDGIVSRVPERPLRIWIAAFQDEKGNLFSDSFVHTILKPGEWQIKTVMEEPKKI